MHKGFAIIGAIMLAITSIFSLQAEVYTLDEARQLFDEGRYSEAAPTFERELKKKSNNGTLNYNYGVCLYHIGRYGDAIKYLDKAVSRKVDKAHFYLGEIYATLYRFDEAIDAYEDYEASLDEDDASVLLTQRISKAKLGARMMRGIEQVQVIDSVHVDSLSFFESYRLTPETGRLISSRNLPFKFPLDTPVVAYIPQRNDIVYLASKLQDNQYDLFQSSQLLGNEWSELLPLSENLNNSDNQRFPFLLGDGQTLYFAQDGESSLGGYDIYITIFNSENGDFMLPQNVGMPFNSPYNDYMMVIDETLGVGWFVSDRNHIPGKLTLYIFIPNEVKTVYQDTEADNLTALAQLSDITATWQADTTQYATLLNEIERIEFAAKSVDDPEFYFVINDELVYTYAADFRNRQALTYFYQAQTLRKKIEERDERLQQLRQQYAAAKPAQQQLLASQILELENAMLEEYESPQVYENRARRAELSYLNMLDE